jgi:hypothetical protein
MAEQKTKQTAASVEEFLDRLPDDSVRGDCRALVSMMRDATGAPARMWGPSIVGFGEYHYKYESGRESDFLLVGFSPRARQLSLYIMAGFDRYDEIMQRLGKYKTGKSCLYVKRLEDIDLAALRELIDESVAYMKRRYPA